MKFIIDAHLPASLAKCFTGHDVIHTSNLKQGNRTADAEINDLSILDGRILITKDSDFYYSFVAARKPYKLILLKFGNMRLKALTEYFSKNASRIISLIETNSFLILEPDTIRILA